MARRKSSVNVLRISRLFVAEPTRKRCCYEIRKELRLDQASAWNNLQNMERDGWLTSEEERVNRSLSGRPRRRLYRLTPLGLRAALAELAELQLPAIDAGLLLRPSQPQALFAAST